jgi:hypothetical protein
VPCRFELEHAHSVVNRVGRINRFYDFSEGRVVAHLINAGYQLSNVGPDDDGF